MEWCIQRIYCLCAYRVVKYVSRTCVWCKHSAWISESFPHHLSTHYFHDVSNIQDRSQKVLLVFLHECKCPTIWAIFDAFPGHCRELDTAGTQPCACCSSWHSWGQLYLLCYNMSPESENLVALQITSDKVRTEQQVHLLCSNQCCAVDCCICCEVCEEIFTKEEYSSL